MACIIYFIYFIVILIFIYYIVVLISIVSVILHCFHSFIHSSIIVIIIYVYINNKFIYSDIINVCMHKRIVYLLSSKRLCVNVCLCHCYFYATSYRNVASGTIFIPNVNFDKYIKYEYNNRNIIISNIYTTVIIAASYWNCRMHGILHRFTANCHMQTELAYIGQRKRERERGTKTS